MTCRHATTRRASCVHEFARLRTATAEPLTASLLTISSYPEARRGISLKYDVAVCLDFVTLAGPAVSFNVDIVSITTTAPWLPGHVGRDPRMRQHLRRELRDFSSR